MKKSIDWERLLLGDPAAVRLENRAFNVVIIFLVLAAATPLIVNIYFGLPWTHTLVSFAAMLVCISGYIYSRLAKNYYKAIPVTVVALTGLCAAVWLIAEGSTGSASFYLFLVLTTICVCCAPKHKIGLIILVLATTFFLLLSEAMYPDIYPVAYETRLSKTVDNGIGLMLCELIFVSVILVVKKQYDKENAALNKALEEIKTLRGFLPICACCKKIRDDKGYWNEIDEYISSHSEVAFTHSLCPECANKMLSAKKG